MEDCKTYSIVNHKEGFSITIKNPEKEDLKIALSLLEELYEETNFPQVAKGVLAALGIEHEIFYHGECHVK